MEAAYGPISSNHTLSTATTKPAISSTQRQHHHSAFTSVNNSHTTNPNTDYPSRDRSEERKDQQPTFSRKRSREDEEANIEKDEEDTGDDEDDCSSRPSPKLASRNDSALRRPRPVHSCDECRRKKLKCDREQPCERCVKARRSTLCHYSNIPTSALGPSPSGKVSRTSLANSSSLVSHSNVNVVSNALTAVSPAETGQLKLFRDAQSAPSFAAGRHFVASERHVSPNANGVHNAPDKHLNTTRDGVASKLISNSQAPGVLEDMLSRLQRLEETVQIARSQPEIPSASPLHRTKLESKSPKRDRMELKRPAGILQAEGKSSRYYSINGKEAVMAEFIDVRSHFDEISRDEQVLQALNEVSHVLPKRRLFERARERALRTEDAIHSLIQNVPDAESFHDLCSVYFREWEHVYRVLDQRSFMSDANKFYSALHSRPMQQLDADVAIAIALVTVISIQFADGDGFGNNISNAEADRIHYLVALAQVHLDSRQGKHRLTTSYIQGLCLLHIGKQLLGAPVDELWQDSEHIMRIAMIMGLHRDPSERHGGMGPVVSEFRRRLWWTCAELNLQDAITIGMPCGAVLAPCSVRPSLNLEDEEMHDSIRRLKEHNVDKREPATYDDSYSHSLPSAHPPNTLTRNSYQAFLGKSFRLRVTAANAAASLDDSLSLETFERVKSDISEALNAAKAWRKGSRASTIPPTGTQPRHTSLSIALFEIFLRKPLIVATRQCMLNSELKASSMPSVSLRDEFVESLLSINVLLEGLDPDLADPNLITSRHYLDVYLRMFVSQIVLSSYYLCSSIMRLRYVSTSKDRNGLHNGNTEDNARSHDNGPINSEHDHVRVQTGQQNFRQNGATSSRHEQAVLSRAIDSNISYLLNNYTDLSTIFRDLTMLSIVHTVVRMAGAAVPHEHVRNLLRDRALKILRSATERGRREAAESGLTLVNGDSREGGTGLNSGAASDSLGNGAAEGFYTSENELSSPESSSKAFFNFDWAAFNIDVPFKRRVFGSSANDLQTNGLLTPAW